MFFQATQKVFGDAFDLVKAPVHLGVSAVTAVGNATLDTVYSLYSCRNGLRLKLTKPTVQDMRNCLYVAGPPGWVPHRLASGWLVAGLCFFF